MTTTAKPSKFATIKAALTRLVRIAAFGYASYKTLPAGYAAVATAGAETFFRLIAPNTATFWTRIAKLAAKWAAPVAAEVAVLDPSLGKVAEQAAKVTDEAAKIVEVAATPVVAPAPVVAHVAAVAPAPVQPVS